MCPRAAAWEGARGDAATARLVRVRGRTALDYAKVNGKDDIALLITDHINATKFRALVAANAGPDAKDESGSTLLHYAAQLGCRHTAKVHAQRCCNTMACSY